VTELVLSPLRFFFHVNSCFSSAFSSDGALINDFPPPPGCREDMEEPFLFKPFPLIFYSDPLSFHLAFSTKVYVGFPPALLFLLINHSAFFVQFCFPSLIFPHLISVSFFFCLSFSSPLFDFFPSLRIADLRQVKYILPPKPWHTPISP